MKRIKKPIQASNLILKSQRYSKIMINSIQYHKMTQALAVFVGAPLSEHFKVVNIHQKKMTLCIESSIWAHNMRLIKPNLLEAIEANQDIFPDIEDIWIKVEQPLFMPAKKKKPTRLLSTKSSTLITESANGIEDQSLKSALLKLASRTEQKK